MGYFFEFHFNSKYLFLLIVFPFFYCFREYLYTTIVQSDKNKENPLFFTLIMFLGEITSTIFELIMKRLERAESIAKNKKKNNIQRSYLDYILLIIIVSLDLSVYTIINVIIGDTFKNYRSINCIIKMIEIIVMGYLSSKILNNPIHRHQMVCIIFFIICIIIGIIIEGFAQYQINKNIFSLSNYFLFLFISILIFTLNSSQYIFEKYMMDKRYFSPYLLLVYMGGIGIILSIIILSFCQIIGLEWSFTKVFDKLKVYDLKDWGIIFLIYVCGTLLNPCLMIIVQKLTTQHVGIGNAISGTLLVTFNDKQNQLSFFKYSLFLIIFFVCLVYTEIIVLKICSLGDYTKNEIDKRGIRETQNIESELTEKVIEEETNEDY